MTKTIYLLMVVGLLLQAEALESSGSNICESPLRQYSVSLQHFLDCSIHNAVPVHFCFNCISNYNEWTSSYNSLINTVDNNTGVKCEEQYVNRNQLNIIIKNHDYFINLWNEADCFGCLNNKHTNQSQETINMISKLDDLQQCIVKWKSDPCRNCETYYGNLNSYYDKVFKEKNKEICFDVRDTLNRTRLLWSKILKCNSVKDVDFGSFAAVAIFTGFFPAVLFYFFSYYFTKRNQIEATENTNIVEEENEENESNSLCSEISEQQEEGAFGPTVSSTREAPEGLDDIDYAKSKIKAVEETSPKTVDLLLL